MNPSTQPGRLKALADTVSGFDDPSMGDERQREVILRAYTFAMQLGLYLSLILAVWLSVVGAGQWSLLPVLFAGLSSWAAIWYCGRDGIDLMHLTRRVRPRRRRAVAVLMTVLVAAWALALGVHIATGSPLLVTGIDLGRESLSGSTLGGAVVGAIVGILAVVVLHRHSRRRAEKACADTLGDED